MKYIDRRLLFPVAAAATVWAQQPSPAAAEAEAALRARVEQFYQLQAAKKFRQAEAFVAEDTKDAYYNGAKQDIREFSIQRIELLDDNTRARVTIKRKVIIQAAALGPMAFDMAAVTTWKVENGQWVWYIDRTAPLLTPFGAIAPPGAAAKGAGDRPTSGFDPAMLMNPVTVDGTSVVLSASDPERTVTVSNNLPGTVTLELEPPLLEGIAVELEKKELKAGEKSALRFRLTGNVGGAGVVKLTALPLKKVFRISVQSK
ncbi:MAG TPA: hypothetical protein VHY84_09810 [Bryobacteraceae bacterium]|jgi:hypothetical protein|nr:hypothetical protein [Bryobacteraceae bacterium]